MRRSFAILTVIVLLIPAIPVHAGMTDIGNAILVKWHPDSLKLWSDDTGTVLIDIRNLSNESLRVGLLRLVMKGSGKSGGNLTPDFFELLPGATQQVQLKIHAYGGFTYFFADSDAYVRVYWGSNLTRNETRWPHFETWEGMTNIVIPVSRIIYDTFCYVAFIIPIVTIGALAGYTIKRWRRSSVNLDTEPPKGPEGD
jgi:hypothetical protein